SSPRATSRAAGSWRARGRSSRPGPSRRSTASRSRCARPTTRAPRCSSSPRRTARKRSRRDRVTCSSSASARSTTRSPRSRRSRRAARSRAADPTGRRTGNLGHSGPRRELHTRSVELGEQGARSGLVGGVRAGLRRTGRHRRLAAEPRSAGACPVAMRPPVGAPTLTRRTRILLVLAGLLVLLLLVGSRLINFYVDWLWFGEVGYRGVFATVLFTQIVQFLVGALLIGGLVALSLWIAYRTRPVFVPVSGPEDPIARYRTVIIQRLRLFGIGIPVVIGVIAGLAAQGDWETVQQFLNSTPFGIADPEFGIDISFYAFQLPFLRYVL